MSHPCVSCVASNVQQLEYCPRMGCLGIAGSGFIFCFWTAELWWALHPWCVGFPREGICLALAPSISRTPRESTAMPSFISTECKEISSYTSILWQKFLTLLSLVAFSLSYWKVQEDKSLSTSSIFPAVLPLLRYLCHAFLLIPSPLSELITLCNCPKHVFF